MGSLGIIRFIVDFGWNLKTDVTLQILSYRGMALSFLLVQVLVLVSMRVLVLLLLLDLNLGILLQGLVMMHLEHLVMSRQKDPVMMHTRDLITMHRGGMGMIFIEVLVMMHREGLATTHKE